MKTLSLIQPWASLIMDGRKTVETRSWATSYRGPLAIHASMKADKDACKTFGYCSKTIPRGVILGTSVLVDCVVFPNPRTPPNPYGDYTSGRYGWLLEDIVRFPTTIPAKGHLSLWEWAGEHQETGP